MFQGEKWFVDFIVVCCYYPDDWIILSTKPKGSFRKSHKKFILWKTPGNFLNLGSFPWDEAIQKGLKFVPLCLHCNGLNFLALHYCHTCAIPRRLSIISIIVKTEQPSRQWLELSFRKHC